MSQVYSITCGLPFCQNTKGEQTNLSIGLRVTAVALGVIAVLGSILILSGTPGLSQFGNIVGWVAFSTGGLLVVVGLSIKCVKNKISEANSLGSSAIPARDMQPNALILESKSAVSSRGVGDAQVARSSEIATGSSLSKHRIQQLVSEPQQQRKKARPAEERITNERELQGDISISRETIIKIQTKMQDILQSTEGRGITFYTSQGNHRIFALDTVPELIFKMNMSGFIRTRYQTMIDAQTVCRTHRLGLLIIPNAKLFTVDKHQIIAERRVDINPNESAQEQYYEDYADSLDEAIRQLAIFICKTGYSDVGWRNNPVLNDSLDGDENRKFALVDIEEMDSAETGLFGGWGRRGLVGCVNERQGRIIEEVARQNRISTTFFADAHAYRKRELEDRRGLMRYYSRTNVVRGDEPIVVDVESIDFSPYSLDKVTTLCQLATDLIEAINDKAAKSSPEESVKGRRYVYINTHHGRFDRMDTTLIEPGEDTFATANAFATDEEYYDATYLGCVVKKFTEMSLIYKLAKRNGHGYYIQA